MLRLTRFIPICLLLMMAAYLPLHAQLPFSQGTNFYMAFPNNISGNSAMEIKIVADAATTGTITSGLGLSQPFSVGPGAPYAYTVPATHVITTNQLIENKGIRITSVAPVSVYAGSGALGGADAVSVAPVASNGNDYRIASFYNLYSTTLVVIASSNNTTVTITPTCATLGGNAANVPFSVVLQQGQSYQVQANCDLTGTRVQGSQPIQVFSHSPCSQITGGNSYCDFLWDSALPISRWGTTYVSGALGGRNGIDHFRILASQNATTVYVNGVLLGTINAGQFLSTDRSGGNIFTANQPICVIQNARSNAISGGNGDPCMLQMYPTTMFSQNYRFATLLHSQTSSHYLTVVSRTAGTGAVRLDGAVVPGWISFGSGWSYVQRTLTTGEHVLTGDSLQHAMVYGWGGVNSYGTPVGATIPVVILPIEGTKLMGTVEDAGNALSWVRPDDIRNGHFELERSLDTESAILLQRVPVTQSQTHYDFLDQDLVSGETYFYRLRWVQANGETAIGDWISLHVGNGQNLMQLYPNPASNQLVVSLPVLVEGDAKVQILDVQGREVHSAIHKLGPGNDTVDLGKVCADLPKGVYLVQATYNGQKFQQKFVHQ